MQILNRVSALNNLFGNIFKKSPWDDNEVEQNIFTKPRKNQLNLNNFQFNMNGKALLAVVFLALFLWVVSGFYRVDEGEEAAVIRFGRYVRKGLPGLNYRLPAPLEMVMKERVNKSRRIEIGYRSSGGAKLRNDNAKFISAESTMLTGDENIIKLTADITWHMKDLEEYLFNVMNPEESVKAAAESAIREVVGNMPIASILSDQKQEIADKISESLQRTLDQYKAGVNIEYVQLLEAEPPAEVIASYRDVQTAKADKEKEINQADAYKNDILPKARGQAAKLIEEASGYKQEVISKAEGDTKRFSSIYAQYAANQQLTKDRLYFETMAAIFDGVSKVIVGTESMLPHMSLSQQNNGAK